MLNEVVGRSGTHQTESDPRMAAAREELVIAAAVVRAYAVQRSLQIGRNQHVQLLLEISGVSRRRCEVGVLIEYSVLRKLAFVQIRQQSHRKSFINVREGAAGARR